MDLEQRVAELERRATRYRNALLLMVVGVCAVAVIGATTDDGVISGRYLHLKNEQGNTVVWAGSWLGDGRLRIGSKTGTDVIYAGTGLSGDGLLAVKSKTGTDLIRAGANSDGDGVLQVNEKTGFSLIYAGGSTTGNGFFFEGYNKTGEGVEGLSAAGIRTHLSGQ